MAHKLKYLIIHCTATPVGREVSAADIRRWHLSPKPAGRGWRQVGYTDMVHINGALQRLAKNDEDEFVDAWEITNGVRGKNSVSRNIVYVGGLDKHGKPCDTRTLEQKQALANYVRSFVAKFPHVKVAGHYQFAAKACPCFNVPAWLREIGIKEENIYGV